jgi:hypothetical protein
LEVVVFDVIRGPVHRNNTIHELGMQSRKRQAGRATHRCTAEDYMPDTKLVPEPCDDLQHVRFRPGAHPGRGGSIVGRDQEHSMLPSNVPNGSAFISILTDELPAIATMTMQGDENVNGPCSIEFGWKYLNVPLFRAVDVGHESDIFRSGVPVRKRLRS